MKYCYYMKFETKSHSYSVELSKATMPLFFGIRKRWNDSSRVVSIHLLLVTLVFSKKRKYKKIHEGAREIRDTKIKNNKIENQQ